MKIRNVVILVGLLAFATVTLSHAQTASIGNINDDIGPVQSAPADTIVSLTAEAQGLQLVPPDQLPRYGTFWVMPPGNNFMPLPYPCPPPDSSWPVWAIADGVFLVDGTVGSQPTLNATLAAHLGVRATPEEALALQANAVVNLINMVQGTAAVQQMRAMGMDVPGFGDTGDGTPMGSPAPVPIDYGTNLWLAITNITGNTVYLVVSNTLPDVQYEIQGCYDLAQQDWISRRVCLWIGTDELDTHSVNRC